ncbi:MULTISPECIES: MarR family winged helix-turn-helix transcriptional regulator [unclassified Brevibacterium]|uniref:MarR family winged helix-turn-helix transcriptional regulator n=1 Tax=unclassified Brevibacterium TaxID=2614124 RepID=UPI0008A33180|nr:MULTISPECIES: MarR family transcriptional regulator [unclassified Brevibacterium]OFL65345.1 MarR family transcriptional regulator [Brevibacterium sp. HMSC063G07]OFS24564.1 MarR family transcriptional regulator [Brevibacterium sp. HMSC07C04]
MDEVDRIVSEWQRERPDLDVAPMEVVSRVSRLAKLLDRARKDIFASHGLDVWSFDVLSSLRRAGSPYQLSPSKLTEQMMVTSGTMTNRIDRLVSAGLVTRSPDPGDRRGVRVQLTEDGLARVDGAMLDFLEREHELMSSMSGTQTRRLADLLRTMSASFDLQIMRDCED